MFAFVKGKNIEFLGYPFDEKILKTYFQNETQSFLKFLHIIMANLSSQNKIFVPENLDEFINFTHYQNSIHWYYRINLDGMVCFAVKNLIMNSNVNTEIHHWLKSIRKDDFRRTNFDDFIDKEDFVTKVKLSTLDIHDKLFLISIVGEKTDYEELLRPTIESLHSEKDNAIRKEIKKILYEVL